jgi:hypothetical protein
VSILLVPEGDDWRVRVSVERREVEAKFAVFRRACDWGRDRHQEFVEEVDG